MKSEKIFAQIFTKCRNKYYLRDPTCAPRKRAVALGIYIYIRIHINACHAASSSHNCLRKLILIDEEKKIYRVEQFILLRVLKE